MKNKVTQFPDPFLYKKSDSNMFSQEFTISSKKQSEISYWRENKSFEIRKAANTKSPKTPDVQMPPPNESPRDRHIRNKIKDINRLISTIKSKYSSETFASRIHLNSTIMQKTQKNHHITVKPIKKKVLEFENLNIILHCNKPKTNPPVEDNPLRRRFISQYQRSYRQVISNFFRL